MPINTLKVASAGYLKRTTKAVLIIAVAGYLNFSGTPFVDRGDGGMARYSHDDDGAKRRRLKQILEDDEIVLTVIKSFLNVRTDSVF